MKKALILICFTILCNAQSSINKIVYDSKENIWMTAELSGKIEAKKNCIINGQFVEYSAISFANEFTLMQAIAQYKNFEFLGTSNTIIIDGVVNQFDDKIYFFKRN